MRYGPCKVRYKAFDLAGHEIGRRLWKDASPQKSLLNGFGPSPRQSKISYSQAPPQDYFPVASAIVFLVDSADRSRHQLHDPDKFVVCGARSSFERTRLLRCGGFQRLQRS